MTTRQAPSEMALDPARLPGIRTETSYALPDGLALADWLAIGETLQRIERSVGWWIGDWWRYGQRAYGSMASTAAKDAIRDATGHTYTTVRHAGLVASRFESGRRRPDLPFSHHAEIAVLAPSDQDVMLGAAVSDRLSTRALRIAVNDRQREVARETTAMLPVVTLPPSGPARIAVADARSLPLPDASVDLIVTSPPYSVGLAYEHGDIPPGDWPGYMRDMLGEALRVTRPSGRLALNVPTDTAKGGSRPLYAVAVALALDAGWTYRSTIVWADGELGKSTARGSRDSASSPYIYAGAEMIALFSRGAWGREAPCPTGIGHEDWLEWTNGVWRFRGETLPWEGAEGAFPIELPRRLISLLSFPGDVILDPHAGSCTTGVAALDLGRQFIGTDISERAVRSGIRRLAARGIGG